MAGQETLIYIEEKDQINAGITAKNFAKDDIQTRAYYNSLGARLVKKFLASEDIDTSSTYDIHNIHKILEELDISDIMLENIHIDVRVVFNENFIFIPKSHFKYEILPDIYLVLLMSNDKKYMKLLGFFDPKLINKNNQNDEYYFIEKEKLTPAQNLSEYIKNFKGNTNKKLSENELEQADFMIVSLIDHDIDENQKKQLLKTLVNSAQVRDRFIEFENFELLSYKAETSPEIKKLSTPNIPDLNVAASATAAALLDFTEKNVADGISNNLQSENDIINGFSNLERNIPDLTPEAEELKIDDNSNALMELSELPEFSDLNAVEDIPTEAIVNTPENTQENTLSEVNDSLELSEDTLLNFDDLPQLENTLKESPLNTSNTEETITLEELPTLGEENIAQNQTEQLEAINLDEIQSSNNNIETSGLDNDVINFDELPTIQTKPAQNQTSETPETISFDEITTEALPATEVSETIAPVTVESFETLENTNTQTEQPINLQTEELLATEELDMLPQAEEMMLDEGLSGLSLDEGLTLNDSSTENADVNSVISVDTSDNVTNQNAPAPETELSTNTLDELAIDNQEIPNIDFPEESISADDQELDQLLSAENLAPIQDEPQEQEEGASIAELNLEENDLAQEPVKSEDDINIDDLKELGLNVEELSNNSTTQAEQSTAELISDIDELLNSSETGEDSSDDSSTSNKLEMLFNANNEETQDTQENYEEFDDTDSAYITQKAMSTPEKGKKAIIIAAAFITVLAAVAGGGMFLKSKNSMNADMLSQNPIESDTNNLPSPEPTQDNVPDNTDLLTGQGAQAPTTGATTNSQTPQAGNKTQKATSNKPVANSKKDQVAKATPAKPSGTPIPYTTVRSLTWEVPDYLSYSDKVKKYLQTAGKSIRLTLSSDLLLANEYAYSNQIKVELKIKNNGTIENIQITKSSGSDQINNIVLRTVKDTLNVVKPAPGEIPTDSFKLGLIINL